MNLAKSRVLALALGSLVFSIVALPRATVRADSLDDRFNRALAHLDAQRPAEAATELRRLVALGIEDPDVYCNLGIAEAEAMHYGRAMVAFERALSLRPSDPVAKSGLDDAETMLARRRADESGGTATVEGARPLATFGRSFPEPVAAFGTLLSAWLAAFALAALAVVRRETARIALGTSAVVATIVFAICAIAVVGRARYGGLIAPGIVITQEVVARSAPDPRAPAAATFTEGERVDLLERHGGYYRVATHGRMRGWLPRRSVGTY
jgi:Tfp pilus assembly protein PilF